MMQGNDSFRLVVRRGPQPNQVHDLTKDIVTLGRDITNDITINDPEVSRHHMRLTRGAGGYTLEDLGSTNGTFVNGQRLTGARPLRGGDMIGLGETVTLAYEAAAVGGYVEDLPGQTAPSQPMRQQAPGASVYPQPAQPQPAAQPVYQQQPAVQPQQPAYSGYNQPPAAQPAYSAPQAPGYDYDPYAVREEGGTNTGRWILIGCGGLSLLCCCGTMVGAFLIDQTCSWSSIPIFYDLIRAFGYTQVC